MQIERERSEPVLQNLVDYIRYECSFVESRELLHQVNWTNLPIWQEHGQPETTWGFWAFQISLPATAIDHSEASPIVNFLVLFKLRQFRNSKACETDLQQISKPT